MERLKAKFDSSRLEVATGFLNYQFLADPEDMRRIAEASAAMGVRLDVDMTDNSGGKGLEARGEALVPVNKATMTVLRRLRRKEVVRRSLGPDGTWVWELSAR